MGFRVFQAVLIVGIVAPAFAQYQMPGGGGPAPAPIPYSPPAAPAPGPGPSVGGGGFVPNSGGPSQGPASYPAPSAPVSAGPPAPSPVSYPAPSAPVAAGPAASPSQSYSSSSSSAGGPPAPSSGSGSGAGAAPGGNLQVQCKSMEVTPGSFKFVCDGVDPSQISLRSEHILWLEGPSGQKQVIDVDIPNYKIEELIKAGFKSKPGEGTQINVKLRKPDQAYDAQVDTPHSQQGTPTVNLQYEPVQKTVAHFPTDKAYSPLQGPLIPPGGGAAANRYIRQSYNPNLPYHVVAN